MNVSVLLLVHNEELNLPRCLAALRWCDDIVVLDSGSTDRTLDIVRDGGARVLQHAFVNFADQRNYGLAHGNFTHDWVLHLDADEVVTPEFAASLAELTPPPNVDAYRVPSKLILFGRWLRHAGMYPTYQVRIGHRERLRFVQVGHGQREALPDERVLTFNEPYLHYSFSSGMQAWLSKHVRYARDEAQLVLDLRRGLSKEPGGKNNGATGRRRAAKAFAARLPLATRPVARFFYILLWRRGFLDGGAGIAYAVMMSVYEGMIAVFSYEAELANSQDTGARRSD